MLRRNFGKVSGIIVDVCTAHGTWFDCGELARILSFVVHGGLELAEERRAEEARRSERQLAQLGPTPAGSWSSDFETTSSPTLIDMEEAARAFVNWVASLLRKPL
jgi:hypothetical protein